MSDEIDDPDNVIHDVFPHLQIEVDFLVTSQKNTTKHKKTQLKVLAPRTSVVRTSLILIICTIIPATAPMYGRFEAKMAASRKTAMDVSSTPIENPASSAFAGCQWNDSTFPAAGISKSPGGVFKGVLAGIGVASEERGDLRKRLRILDELDVIVIGVISY